jgi:hypothetical protein
MRQELLSHLTLQPLKVGVVALIAGLGFSAAAQAAPADLDLTFSGAGRRADIRSLSMGAAGFEPATSRV